MIRESAQSVLPILTLRDISVFFGERAVLTDVRFVVRKNELTCVVGPNGAGKSTLLSVLAGATPPTRGEALAGDRDLSRMPPTERARWVSVLRQAEALDLPFRVREIVLFGRFPHTGDEVSAEDERIVAEAMRAANVSELAERRLYELSGGEQRRVHLARILAQRTPLMLLDEPAASLDLREQRNIEEIVAGVVRGGASAVVVTHDVARAMAMADRLVILSRGRVAWEGPPADVSAEVLCETFGVPFVAIEVAGGRRAFTESRE